MKRSKMRHFCTAVVMGVAVTASTAAQIQDGSLRPTLSSDPLTAEQIAIYSLVVNSYLRGNSGGMNIASMTEPIDQTHPFFNEDCLKDIQAEPTKESNSVVHRLDLLAAGYSNLVIVDRDRQQQQMQKNDPQKLVKRAIDDHEKITEKELDHTVKKAFETGIFSLSEIVFDKQHRHAVVAYSFVCGSLCGNGNTLLLRKVGKRWKISKRCGGWVS